MTDTAATILLTLRRLNLGKDSCVIVHSAFKDCARSGLDAEQTVRALADYMSNGTLLMPAMSWRYVKPGGHFSEMETPSNTGILTEIFRRTYATHRSIHPTHSVSGMGRLAHEILLGHQHCTTPCGKGSPFESLILHDGWIVMLGITMDCCSLIHYVEETVAPDIYLRSEPDDYSCVDRNGVEWPVRFRRHAFLPRDYWQIQDALAAAGQMHVTRVGYTIIRAFRARDVVVATESILRRSRDAIIAKHGQRYRLM